LLPLPSCNQKNEEGDGNFAAVAFFVALQLSCSLAKEEKGDGFFFFLFGCQKKKATAAFLLPSPSSFFFAVFILTIIGGLLFRVGGCNG
jgi:hypothetical protein